MITRYFSWSKILDYATCPQKYYLRQVLGIQPKAKAKPLVMGSCVSMAIRSFRKGEGEAAALAAFMSTWEKEGKVLLLKPDPDQPKDFRTVQRGLELIQEYIQKYPDEPKHIAEPEVPFEIPLFTTEMSVEGALVEAEEFEIILRGRIDGVIVPGADINIIEDKTTSQLGETFLPNLAGSLQIKIYLWAADQYGLFEVGGKKKTPRCLMNAMRVHPTEFRFKRDITIQSRPQLELAKENVINWIKRILEAEKDGNFPLNDVDNTVCTKYGGCEYLPLRYKTGSVRESLLKHEYIIKPPKKGESNDRINAQKGDNR